MICDRCGMQNVDRAAVCANCGTPMPELVKCGGFADILNFENVDAPMAAVSTAAVQNGGYNEEDMRNLIRKTDSVIVQNAKNGRIGTIAAVISVIVLVCSIAFGFMTMKAVNEAQQSVEEAQESIKAARASIEKRLDEIKSAENSGKSNKEKEEEKDNSVENGLDDLLSGVNNAPTSEETDIDVSGYAE